jgi:hypothetical protein
MGMIRMIMKDNDILFIVAIITAIQLLHKIID